MIDVGLIIAIVCLVGGGFIIWHFWKLLRGTPTVRDTPSDPSPRRVGTIPIPDKQTIKGDGNTQVGGSMTRTAPPKPKKDEYAGRRRDRDDDWDDDLLNPANPISPLSPINPANPLYGEDPSPTRVPDPPAPDPSPSWDSGSSPDFGGGGGDFGGGD